MENKKIITIYYYDFENKEFINSFEQEDRGAISFTLATLIKPLEIKEGFARIFNEDKQKWEYKIDNRNKIYFLNGEKVDFKIGDEITQEMSTEQYTHEQKLQFAENEQKNIVNISYNQELAKIIIINNIEYSLSSMTTYSNLILEAKALDDEEIDFLDANKNKQIFTVIEAQRILKQLKTKRNEINKKYDDLILEIETSLDIEKIKQIIWE